ncbi:MAG: hypothetical protein K6A30_09015 [Lachnospiraceae bacterium]|nr:hypothetical protein [Lachnospiraceae bacterium]
MKRKGTITVEASVIMVVMLLVFGNFMSMSIKLYNEIKQSATYIIEPPKIDGGMILRIKHLGGELYENFKLQGELPEEVE